MLKVNDYVNCIYNNYLMVKVVEVKGTKVLCNCTVKVTDRFGNISTKTDVMEWFSVFELTKNEGVDFSVVKENKWADLINKIPNMQSSVRYMYDNYIECKLDMNPFYQRDIVWTEEQKRKYIEAIFESKVTISATILLNYKNYEKNTYEILDGKQRLTAVFEFLEGKFSIYNNLYYDNLNYQDRAFFINSEIVYTRIEKINRANLTDNEKIDLFLEINGEGGTKMSDEHMNKIRGLKK